MATVVLHPGESGWLREALALGAGDEDLDEEAEQHPGVRPAWT